VPEDRDGHRRRDAEQRDELHRRVRDRAQPCLAARNGQHGDELADDERHGGQREPLDLLPQQPATAPVPNGERHERGREERDEHRR
jgi:hypothetical protein